MIILKKEVYTNRHERRKSEACHTVKKQLGEELGLVRRREDKHGPGAFIRQRSRFAKFKTG